MSYYAPYPGFYPYPMGYPGQEYYAMYPPDQMDPNDPIFYNGANLPNNYMPNNNFRQDKAGYNNRKESNDSGISDASSRKVSSVSTISNVSSCIVEDLEDADDDKPFEIPDDELCIQISQQVEFYFSDANICKDKFLLKHVKRNKEGFVSLKLISSFKRLKHLTKDWRQVGYAVEKMSKKLEINDQKTKVRRMDSLPEHDETALSRTVLVLNLPMERPTIESVAEIFSICGDVALIRILRPGNPLPADVRPFASKNPDLTSKVCALIEFERTEFALRARKLLNSEEDDQLKVMELVAPVPSKAAKKAEERKKFAAAKQQQQQLQQQQQMQQQQQQQRRYSQGSGNNTNQNQAAPMPRRKIGVFGNPKFSPIVEEQNMRAEGLNPNSQSYPQQQRKNSRPNQQQNGSGSNGGNSSDAAGISAWMTRRISGGQLEFSRSGLTLPPNVIRQPRGPEEGKGFQRWVKTRMEPAAAVAIAKTPETAAVAEKSASNDVTEEKKTDESQNLADSCEAAISRLTVAPVILTHSEESCSDDEDDDESNKESEKSR